MKSRKVSVGAKIGLGIGALTAALVLLAADGLYTISAMRDSLDRVADRTSRQAILAGRISAAQSDMEAAQRGVVLFNYAKKAEELAGSKEQFQRSLATLRQSLAELKPVLDDDRSKGWAADLELRAGTWVTAYADFVRLVDSGDADGAAQLLTSRLKPLSLAVAADADRLVDVESQALISARDEAIGRLVRSRWTATLLMILGGLICSAAFVWVRQAIRQARRVASEMFEGSRQVAAAAGQIASASQSLAQGTSEQAATLEETSSSAAEITAVTRTNAQNTATVAGTVKDTSRLVEDANQSLRQMIGSMSEINASSEKISKIIRVIDEIAFQTNILALNAAVEAARAGEAGMGFAVVADEVRNLAHRSAQAAKDTAALIEESIGKATEGGRTLNLVVKAIQQITGSANQVKTLVDEIDAGSQEQARGIEQIAGAVAQMEQVTQRSAANAEESAAASEELATQAQRLSESIESLRTIVGEEKAAGGGRFVGDRHTVGLAPKLASLRASHAAFPLDESESGL